MKKIMCAFVVAISMFVFCSCANTDKDIKQELINEMTQIERNSIKFGDVNSQHKYYNEVENVVEHIKEMSIYDEELDKTYIVHITLPPQFDKNKTYPIYMMTDGIWRLSDHAELRPLMENGEICDIIMVSVGYDYSVDPEIAEDVSTREVEFILKNDLFLSFLTNNLMPYMGELYNIDYERSALMGHSLGGLFVHYAVFNYIMASPSFWYTYKNGSKNTVYSEYGYFVRNTEFYKDIFVTVGE